MVPGEICPVCGSTNCYDNDLCYTYEPVARVSAGWTCQNCNTEWEVLFKAKSMIVRKFIEEDSDWDDNDVEVSI